jgi:hypothetical protein
MAAKGQKVVASGHDESGVGQRNSFPTRDPRGTRARNFAIILRAMPPNAREDSRQYLICGYPSISGCSISHECEHWDLSPPRDATRERPVSLFLRHCERSEAIQRDCARRPGLPRGLRPSH